MSKNLGIEIELTGVSRKVVVKALENLFHSKAKEVLNDKIDNPYYYYGVTDTNGETWLVVRDRSIKPQIYRHNMTKCSDYKGKNLFDIVDLEPEYFSEYMIEIVSPVLTSETLPILFSVIDVLNALGGLTNSSCGIHIHIDKPNDFADLLTLFRKYVFQQDEIYNHFGVADWRKEKYCKIYDNFSLDRDFSDEKEFMNYMYENYVQEDEARRNLRYYGLNIHSINAHRTLEFRIFNATLDKAKIAYILDWVLHFCYNINGISDYIPYLSSILNDIMKEGQA